MHHLPKRFYRDCTTSNVSLPLPAQVLLCELADKAEKLARGYFRSEGSLADRFAEDLAIILERHVLAALAGKE